MKKCFFIGLAAMGMLASCTSNEVLEVAEAPQSFIGFDAFVNRPGRGVTDVTAANMQQFNVWGYQNTTEAATGAIATFDNQVVTGNSGSFTYSPLKYWTAGYNYWFTAYSADAKRASVTFTPDAIAWPTSTPAATPLWGAKIEFDNGTGANGANGDVDLLYAWWKTDDAVAQGREPSAVTFSFKHLLSKVAFKFINGLPGNSIKITALKINGVHSAGTLDMTGEGTTAWERGTETFDLDFANDLTNAEIAQMNGETKIDETTGANCLIPGAFGYNITFTVQVLLDSSVLATYNHTVTVSGLDMAIGTYYVLTAELNSENINPDGALKPIVFQPTVEDWTNGGETAVTFPDSSSSSEGA